MRQISDKMREVLKCIALKDIQTVIAKCLKQFVTAVALLFDSIKMEYFNYNLFEDKKKTKIFPVYKTVKFPFYQEKIFLNLINLLQNLTRYHRTITLFIKDY